MGGKAQEEHDGFVEVLEAGGVKVRQLADLLQEALADESLSKALVERVASVDTCGVELVDRVRGHLTDLDRAQLVERLVGGLTVEEVPGAAKGFVGRVLRPAAFLIPPLPNTVFTRDPSAFIGGGVVKSPMSRPARKAERLLWDTVYRHHPDYAKSPKWYGDAPREYFPATLEGGDVLVLSQECVAIGLSERTHPIAAENLAARLFKTETCTYVLSIDLPKGRRTDARRHGDDGCRHGRDRAVAASPNRHHLDGSFGRSKRSTSHWWWRGTGPGRRRDGMVRACLAIAESGGGRAPGRLSE